MARRKSSSTPAPSVAQQAATRARAARAEETAEREEQPAAPAPVSSSAAPLVAPRPRAGGGNISASSSSASARRAARARVGSDGEPVRRSSKNELDLAAVEDALRHPTKFPTEAELHTQYGFVLRDLRNMGLLAGALVVVLFALASFLPG